MNLRKAEVLYKDTPAGTLEETAGGGTRFTYGAHWKESVACALPILRREHEWPQGVHPFFQHLGPEGWLREKQARTAHINDEDDFGLLLRYGADCIGAVGLRPAPGLETKEIPASELAANPSRTLSGIQPKLLVVKEGAKFIAAGATGAAPYIAKFNSEREGAGSLVRNEALSLRWCAALLGKEEVNEFEIGTVEDKTALIVTRFDRTTDGGKLRLEDFAQILSKPRGRDFSGKYDASYEDVAAVIKEHSVRPEIDLAKFFRRLVVFVLVGNCDAHLKNFSLLETKDGLRLSPAYDILNTALYQTLDQNIALSVAGKKPNLDQVTRAVLEKFAKSIGIAPSAINQIFSELKRGVQRAANIIQPPQGEPPDGFVHRYQEIVSRACLRILGE